MVEFVKVCAALTYVPPPRHSEPRFTPVTDTESLAPQPPFANETVAVVEVPSQLALREAGSIASV